MTQSWDSMRKEARILEVNLEAKLVDYSKLAASLQSTTRSSFDSSRGTPEDEALQRRSGHRETRAAADAMTTDMESLLARLRVLVDAMGVAVTESGPTPAPALQRTMHRHAEILRDYNQEFRKTMDALAASRDHADLMAGAAAAAAEGGRVRAAGDGPGLDGLYKERASIAGATAGADSAIATGLSLKEDLERQRAMFASMVERMETMSEGLPAVNRLIGQIRRKKKRDVLIMAAVLGTMLFITFSWKVTH